jgi:MFS family permease
MSSRHVLLRTLYFLLDLAGSPYHYDSLTIGLFGLIGIAGMLISPFWARRMTDRFVPHFSILFGLTCSLVAVCLGTYIGTFNVAGPVLQALLLDFGNQTAQIAQRSAIYTIEPKRRNGVNTAFMVSTFCGQLIGTAAGNHIYAAAGWVGSGSASVGFISAALLVMVVRGPWEEGWVGWTGGWSPKKKNKDSADGKTSEKAHFGANGKIRDEEEGAVEKVLEEIAAEDGNESPLHADARSEKSSGEDAIRSVKK